MNETNLKSLNFNFSFSNQFSFLDIEIDQTLTGGENNDLLEGGEQNDLIQGLDGNDTLEGFSGTDYIEGGEDDDIINGSSGDDRLIGDTTLAKYTLENVRLYLPEFGFSPGGIGSGNDFLNGGDGNDILDGVGGNDTLIGGEGDDILFGGDSNGNDTLIGGAGDDSLFGDNGSDRLVGDDGNDTLAGGRGNDTLTGGSGADEFRFRFTSNTYWYGFPGSGQPTPESGIDTVEDYNAAEGDQLIISAPDSIVVDQFQYNSETGSLSYNGEQFAELPTGLDFVPQQDLVLNLYTSNFWNYIEPVPVVAEPVNLSLLAGSLIG